MVCRNMHARSLPPRRPCRLTTLSMSFQVFSTVLRSAAGCFGGPTASWIASMRPKIRPLLRFGPRPPGFRPLRAVAMSYVLEDRSQDYRLQSDFQNVITFLGTLLHLQTISEAKFPHLWLILAPLLLNFATSFHQDSPCHVPTLLIHDSGAKSHCNQITFKRCLRCLLCLCCACLPALVQLLLPSDLLLLSVNLSLDSSQHRPALPVGAIHGFAQLTRAMFFFVIVVVVIEDVRVSKSVCGE